MARWWREVVSLAFLILIPGARSLPGQYLQPGQAVDDPETITGVWEMPVVDGAVGLTIKLNVAVKGEPRQFTSVDQRVHDYEIGIYHRTQEEFDPHRLNLFVNDNEGVELGSNRLTIQVSYRKPAVTAQLRFDPQKETWTGFLEIEGFHGSVRLRRPTDASTAAMRSLAGTCRAVKGAPGGSCLHLARTGGVMTAWLDRLVLSGLFRRSPGAAHWESTPWSYGAFVITKPAGPSGLDLVFDPFTAFCCSSTFHAKLSAGGMSLTGSLETGQGVGGPEVWSRVRGPGCRSGPYLGEAK